MGWRRVFGVWFEMDPPLNVKFFLWLVTLPVNQIVLFCKWVIAKILLSVIILAFNIYQDNSKIIPHSFSQWCSQFVINSVHPFPLQQCTCSSLKAQAHSLPCQVQQMCIMFPEPVMLNNCDLQRHSLSIANVGKEDHYD